MCPHLLLIYTCSYFPCCHDTVAHAHAWYTAQGVDLDYHTGNKYFISFYCELYFILIIRNVENKQESWAYVGDNSTFSMKIVRNLLEFLYNFTDEFDKLQ